MSSMKNVAASKPLYTKGVVFIFNKILPRFTANQVEINQSWNGNDLPSTDAVHSLSLNVELHFIGYACWNCR